MGWVEISSVAIIFVKCLFHFNDHNLWQWRKMCFYLSIIRVLLTERIFYYLCSLEIIISVFCFYSTEI